MQSREDVQKSRLETQKQQQSEQNQNPKLKFVQQTQNLQLQQQEPVQNQSLRKTRSAEQLQQSEILHAQSQQSLHFSQSQRQLRAERMQSKIAQQAKLQPKKQKYQLSDTMKENVLDDFVSIRIDSDLKHLEFAFKHTMPNVFFTTIYAAACVSPNEYENVIAENLKTDTTNRQNIASMARKINMILRCQDFEALKTLEPYNYLLKIQPPKNAEEAHEAVQQIQAILRPQYLRLVAKVDVHSSQYNLRESLLQDFVALSIDANLKHLEFAFKHTMPNIFFTTIYAAACVSPNEYENVIAENLKTATTNRQNIASMARKINMILLCPDFKTLKTLEPYNYLLKSQPPKNAEEEREAVQQIQAILRPQYLRLVAKVDVYSTQYNFKESLLQDFAILNIGYYLKHLEFSLKDTMPNLFFTLVYSAVSVLPKEYESILSQYLDETDSNDKFIASTARKINSTLCCQDLETLKTLEPYNYLLKSQPPKNAEEAHETVQQVQAILRSQYLRLVAKVDIHSVQYDFRESLLQDFVTVRIAHDISRLEYGLKDTMPNVFFTLIYSAACESPKKYESILSQYLDETNSNAKLIASIAKKVNSTLCCQDFEALKALELYNYLEKIQPPKDAEEAHETVQQIQAILRPKYLRLVAKVDVYSTQYDFRESLLQDFVVLRLTYDIGQLEYCLKDTMPNVFFTLIYSAACESPKEYESILSQYLDETNSNAKLIASIAKKVNSTLCCQDFETLKTLEPYNYLDKIQPPKKAEEAHETVQQIQAILRPKYLRLVAKVDVHSTQYNFRESLLQDFAILNIGYYLSQLEYSLKHTMPDVFFTLIYSAACESPKEYENVIAENFQTETSNDKLIASIAKKVNSTLCCQDLETLKTLEPYNYLLKSQPPKNAEEAHETVQQIQAILRPKYVQLVEQIDVDGKYTELVKYGWIKDFKQIC